MIFHARGAHCFLAHLDGRPIAAAGVVLNTDVALLAGASTIPEARRRGAQQALLDARLATGAADQPVLVDSIERQEQILRSRNCGCLLDPVREEPSEGR